MGTEILRFAIGTGSAARNFRLVDVNQGSYFDVEEVLVAAAGEQTYKARGRIAPGSQSVSSDVLHALVLALTLTSTGRSELSPMLKAQAFEPAAGK